MWLIRIVSRLWAPGLLISVLVGESSWMHFRRGGSGERLCRLQPANIPRWLTQVWAPVVLWRSKALPLLGSRRGVSHRSVVVLTSAIGGGKRSCRSVRPQPRYIVAERDRLSLDLSRRPPSEASPLTSQTTWDNLCHESRWFAYVSTPLTNSR